MVERDIMAERAIDSIQDMNQYLIEREVAATVIIQNQWKALTEDMAKHHLTVDSAVVPQMNPPTMRVHPRVELLRKNFNERADETIADMLRADSKEAFEAHKKRFDALVGKLRATLEIGPASEEELVKYSIYQQVKNLLKDVTSADASVKTKQLIASWAANSARKKKHYVSYAVWEVKLNALANNSDNFESNKNDLKSELMVLVSENNLANRASVALIERNAHSLAARRLSYLKEKFNRKELSASSAWIAAGVLLGIAGTVLGFAFPYLIIPGFLLGAAAMSHGAVDFFKESIALGAQITSATELGDRDVLQNTKEAIESFESKIPGNNPILVGLFSEKIWSTASKWQQALGYGMVFVSLAIAITGFVTLFPGMAIPFMAVIALTIVGTLITAAALGLYGYQVFQIREELSALNREVDVKITADHQKLSEPIAHLYQEDTLSSSDGMMLRAFSESKEAVNAEVSAQINEPLVSSRFFQAKSGSQKEFRDDFNESLEQRLKN